MVAPVCRLVPPSLHGDALLVCDDSLTICVLAQTTEARCLLCGERGDRVHRRATHALVCLPWTGITVHLRVRVQKFFCDTPPCPRRIFSEPLPGIVAVAARRTDRQRAALLDLAVALGGEVGVRMAAKRSMRVSPDTLLQLLRQAPAAVRFISAEPLLRPVDQFNLENLH